MKQQHLMWACMRQWAGICKHKSHQISCSTQYQTLCGCLILMSLADRTAVYTQRQLVCDILSEGKWSDHILIRILFCPHYHHYLLFLHLSAAAEGKNVHRMYGQMWQTRAFENFMTSLHVHSATSRELFHSLP